MQLAGSRRVGSTQGHLLHLQMRYDPKEGQTQSLVERTMVEDKMEPRPTVQQQNKKKRPGGPGGV